MLQAVHVIHEEKIVHSDLKPANFVVVRGQLKLIDFGIANAIANDTTNIHRESQVGTVNYMSPEAIELQEGLRRFKVGRPSDIWSLGCILYQMITGVPPFRGDVLTSYLYQHVWEAPIPPRQRRPDLGRFRRGRAIRLQTLGELGWVRKAFADVERFHLGGEHMNERNEQRRRAPPAF